MEYRKEPNTGIVYNEETVIERYGMEIGDSGVIIGNFKEWEKVDVYFDSSKDTLKHIRRVAQLLNEASIELLRRANVHDNSKLEEPEKYGFDKYTPKLKALTYGSDAYKESLKGLGESLSHHYKNNSHHPEYYENGIDGMNLFDVIEMLIDWKAATERHRDGNIMKSIEINKDRFKISDQLRAIIENTLKYLR